MAICAYMVCAAEVLATIHECDRRAANPYDERRAMGVTGIVHHRLIDHERAVPACRAAVLEYPAVARFQYQLGRALWAAGDYEEAFAWAKKAADQRYVTAYQGIAWAYRVGKGVPKDCEQEFKYWQMAAEANHPPAQHELGRIHARGLCGMKSNWTKAAEYVTQAAEAGFPQAQNTLSVMYEKGSGVQRNYKEALNWARIAAANGNEDAKRRLTDLEQMN